MKRSTYEVQTEIVLIDKNNFTSESLDDFCRYQEVKKVYRLVEGTLQLVYHPFIEDWTPEDKREKAKEIQSGTHIVYGAFEGSKVVGEIMLLPELDRGRMIIDSYHVTAGKRRHGIGRALFEAAKSEALRHGAAALYASACSSQETINFYLAMGFVVSPHPIRACVDAEPCDIQMECVF